MYAPKSWLLDKLGGTFAPKPSSGPHRSMECIPLCLLLTRKLGYAVTSKEVNHILREKMIKVNGRIRTDKKFPVGFMDVLSIDKTDEHFRLLYNVNKRFYLHKITPEESGYKLCKVVKKLRGSGGIPCIHTDDGFTFRYVNPAVKVNDTVKVDLSTQRVVDYIPFRAGKLAFAIRGGNLGCIGVISSIEKHPGGFDILYLKDLIGRQFATRVENGVVIGDVDDPWITLPKGNGAKVSELEKSNVRFGALASATN